MNSWGYWRETSIKNFVRCFQEENNLDKKPITWLSVLFESSGVPIRDYKLLEKQESICINKEEDTLKISSDQHMNNILIPDDCWSLVLKFIDWRIQHRELSKVCKKFYWLIHDRKMEKHNFTTFKNSFDDIRKNLFTGTTENLKDCYMVDQKIRNILHMKENVENKFTLVVLIDKKIVVYHHKRALYYAANYAIESIFGKEFQIIRSVDNIPFSYNI